MKRYSMVLSALVASIFLVWGLALGETVVIKNKAGKVPYVEKKAEPKMEKIDTVGGDKPENKCEGWTYGTFIVFNNDTIKVNNIVMEPKGRIGTHMGGHYACLVGEGEGDLVMVDPNTGKDVDKFHYKPGDVIIFEPDTLHYWVNGNKKTMMFGVEPITK